jgi:hypothetical protein
MLTTKYLLSQMLVNPSQLQDNCLFYTGRLEGTTPPRLSEAAQAVGSIKNVSTLVLSCAWRTAKSTGLLISDRC